MRNVLIAIALGLMPLVACGGLTGATPNPGDGPTGPAPEAPTPLPEEPLPEPEPEPLPEPGDSVVRIEPGDNVQQVIDGHPPGTTFVFASGVHRMQSFIPRSGDEYVGEKGAVLTGAKMLDGWQREGDLWVVGDQTQDPGEVPPLEVYNGALMCTDSASDKTRSPRCNYPHDLFLDNVMLRHVASKSAVRPGTWFFDYDADKIYLGDDPTGKLVETSVAPYAIAGQASTDEKIRGVTVRGLTIEKYATPPNEAAVETGPEWTVKNVVVRQNHAVGLRLGAPAKLSDSFFHLNGQLGVTGTGPEDENREGIEVVNNEIAYNNVNGFNTNWAGGGTKFTKTRNLVLKWNYVHDNIGPGLATDADNIHVLVQENRVIDNEGTGIHHEVGYDAVIADNVVEGNGFGRTNWVLGAGIFVNASSNVTIRGNTVRDNYQGVILVQTKRDVAPGPYGPYELKDIQVTDNLIEMSRGQTGMVVAGNIEDPDYYFNNGIVFQGNDYKISGQSKPFKWRAGSVTEQQWKSAGNDTSGTFERQSVAGDAP